MISLACGIGNSCVFQSSQSWVLTKRKRYSGTVGIITCKAVAVLFLLTLSFLYYWWSQYVIVFLIRGGSVRTYFCLLYVLNTDELLLLCLFVSFITCASVFSPFHWCSLVYDRPYCWTWITNVKTASQILSQIHYNYLLVTK